MERASGSGERFRCADLAVGSGNAQAGASKVGMQRGNWVVKFDLSAFLSTAFSYGITCGEGCRQIMISRLPENQVELSSGHHNSCTILGTTAI